MAAIEDQPGIEFLLGLLRNNCLNAANIYQGGGVKFSRAISETAVGREAYLTRELLRRRGIDRDWATSPSRSEHEILQALRRFNPSRSEVAQVLGPHWESMVFLLCTQPSFGQEVKQRMDRMRSRTRVGWYVAVGHVVDAAQLSGINVDISNGRTAPQDWCALRGAAWATALRNLVGTESFPFESYRSLLHPYCEVGLPSVKRAVHQGEASPVTRAAIELFPHEAAVWGFEQGPPQ